MVLYNIVAHVAVVSAIVNFNLPPVPALVLSVEQVRGQIPLPPFMNLLMFIDQCLGHSFALR